MILKSKFPCFQVFLASVKSRERKKKNEKMDFGIFLKYLILSTEFVLYIVCLYNTPWYIRNLELVSKKGGYEKAFNITLINFIHIPNKMLLKKPIAWLTAPSLKECRTKCISLPVCISFNARRITDQVSQTSQLHCDFFDDDHYANQLFLIDAHEVDYYVPKVSQHTEKLYNIKLLYKTHLAFSLFICFSYTS